MCEQSQNLMERLRNRKHTANELNFSFTLQPIIQTNNSQNAEYL